MLCYMHFILSVPDYVVAENMWCGPQTDGEYLSVEEAMDACHLKPNCKMFYDLESKNENYILCGFPYEIKESNGLSSRLYKKCKNSVTI